MNEVRAALKTGNVSAGAMAIPDIVTINGIHLSRYRADRIMKELELTNCKLLKQ